MTAPLGASSPATAVAASAAVLLSAGCAAVTGRPGSGSAAGATDTAATADTAPAPASEAGPGPAAGEESDAGADDPARRRAAADSAYLALLDSARALARGGGEPAATPRSDTARPEPEDSAKAAATDDGYPAGPVTVTDVAKLRELGPVYTPYDIGPRLATREERLDGLLKATLVPVIQRYELAPDEWARYWILVDAEGEVRDAVLQLPSGHSSFDEAARAVAENLRFRPAGRGDRAVPVWILTRISLLMR